MWDMVSTECIPQILNFGLSYHHKVENSLSLSSLSWGPFVQISFPLRCWHFLGKEP